jgi:3-deoxy-manno-octulosonate cytidylyltransferase (CMP-KDO synthetase)
MLADLCGRPLLWHVWQRVAAARRVAQIVVATDDGEIAAAVAAWGGRAVLTSPDCTSGTARVASILDHLDGEYVVNVQGDEPLIDPALIDALIEHQVAASLPLVTAACRLRTVEEIADPNVVKVARAASGRALYFSRSPIPFVRDVPRDEWLGRHVFWGHIGIYGYSRPSLEAYASASEGPLEAAERLEQLRFLDLGLAFDLVEAERRSQAVDTAEDLSAVARVMRTKSAASD